MAHQEPHFADGEWVQAYDIKQFLKRTGADDREAAVTSLTVPPECPETALKSSNMLASDAAGVSYNDQLKRKYIRSLERQSEKLRMRNQELISLLVSLGQDVEPYTNDVDAPFSTVKAPYTAVASPPAVVKPNKFLKEPSHDSRCDLYSQQGAAIAHSVRQGPAGIPPEHHPNPYNILRPMPRRLPRKLLHEQQRTVLSSPWSRNNRRSPPTVAVSIRGIAERLALAYRDAEALVRWITNTQVGKRELAYTELLKDCLRYNIEELVAAIKVRDEEYGRKLWFILEDSIATEALENCLASFEDDVLKSLLSIRDSDWKIGSIFLIEASNFARVASIAALDESSLHLAQTATVAKSLVGGNGMQTLPYTPKIFPSAKVAAHMGNGLWQSSTRLIQMQPANAVPHPISANAPGLSSISSLYGPPSPTMLAPYTDDFCKGTYSFGEGRRSETLKIKGPTALEVSQYRYWSCAIPNCAYEGLAYKIGGHWTLDNTIRQDYAVRYRWSFLAKCHLPTNTGHGGFMCALCIPKNLPLSKYQSGDALMEHVASHAGQRLDSFIGQNISVICGRTALQGELFDINFPSPIGDVEPASTAVLMPKMDSVHLVSATALRTDCTMSSTSPDSTMECQQSHSQTRKSPIKEGHRIMESNIVDDHRQAFVGNHEHPNDTGGTTEAYQIPEGKPTTASRTSKQQPRGRLVSRNFPCAPIPSRSDTSSLYSGSTHDSSTYGSWDDSSITSSEDSEGEPQYVTNDPIDFALTTSPPDNVKIKYRGDAKDSGSRVRVSSPYAYGSHAFNPGPEVLISQQSSSDLGDSTSASNTADEDSFKMYKQGSLIKQGVANSDRLSSHSASSTIFHTIPVNKQDNRAESIGDNLGTGKIECYTNADVELIAGSEALLDESGERTNELVERLEEDPNVHNICHPPRLLVNRTTRDSQGTHPVMQPAVNAKLSRHAEAIGLRGNDDKPLFRVDSEVHEAIDRTCDPVTRHESAAGFDGVVKVPSWGFILKHFLALTILVGTYSIHYYEVKYHKSLDHSPTMEERYNVCVKSVQMAAWTAILYTSSKLLDWRLGFLASRNRKHVIGDPKKRISESLRILNGQEYTASNDAKRYVERMTGKQWNWWPFIPSFRPLQPGEVRVEWECELQHTHWLEFSRNKVHHMFSSLRAATPTMAIVQPSVKNLAGHSSASRLSISSQMSRSQSSDSRSSPSTTGTGFSSPPSDNADGDDNGSSEQEHDASDDAVTVDIVPPSKLNGYILFGVQGSKRLHSSKTRLAQIDVNVCKDDDSFFDEMKVQFQLLRGHFRWIFSIWIFQACEFVMFYKANPNEIMPGPEEMPPVADVDYRFAADRNPPVLSSVFNASFYGCEKACIKSQLDVMSIFHECKGRNHCGRYRILERLPKRQRKWEIDRDEEKEETWGLHATFGIAFYKVAVYHLLILAAPIISWGVWLRKWPTDWQNASVPFFAVVVLLSLFWLPFAHNVGPKDKGKHKIA